MAFPSRVHPDPEVDVLEEGGDIALSDAILSESRDLAERRS